MSPVAATSTDCRAPNVARVVNTGSALPIGAPLW